MRTAQTKQTAQTRSHRPRAITVFAAAFVAGAAAAVGVNRALDVRLAQSKPRVESEAIFVALRSLPQGAAVTVWDVALRDWPKAMMPSSALRASDTFSGHVLKHPLREGQPLLSIQLAPAGQGSQPAAAPTAVPPPAAYTQISTPVVPTADGDLWSPAEPVKAPIQPPTQQPVPQTAAPVAQTASPAVDPIAQQSVEPPTEAAPIAVPPQEPVAASELAPTEPAPTEPDHGVAAAAEAVVADSSTPAAEAPATPQPQTATPEPTATTDIASPAASAATNDIPEPAVAPPTAPMAPAPIAATPPTQSAPVASPRPTYSRYLVVPESIAVQADASFVAPAVPPQQAAATPSGPQTASRSGSNAVRPLPSTTPTDRGGQARAPQGGSQGRPPQRHGRQAQPANPGSPANAVPQPRLGSAMFPNLSAGIEAIEGRFRGDQPTPGQAQGQAPTAAQARPLTAR